MPRRSAAPGTGLPRPPPAAPAPPAVSFPIPPDPAPGRTPELTTVVFDWDGTLVDSFAATRAASLTVFRHFGITMDEARYRDTYRPDWHRTYRELGIPESRWEEAGALWNAAFAERSADLRLLPGATDTLDRLEEAGRRFGVVTTAERRRLDADLDRFGLRGRFPVTVAFEDCRRRKPHPEGLLAALAALGAAPAETLYLGDRPEDVAMGKGAGTRTAALLSAFSSVAMLRAAAPDLLLRTLAALPAALSLPLPPR